MSGLREAAEALSRALRLAVCEGCRAGVGEAHLSNCPIGACVSKLRAVLDAPPPSPLAERLAREADECAAAAVRCEAQGMGVAPHRHQGAADAYRRAAQLAREDAEARSEAVARLVAAAKRIEWAHDTAREDAGRKLRAFQVSDIASYLSADDLRAIDDAVAACRAAGLA